MELNKVQRKKRAYKQYLLNRESDVSQRTKQRWKNELNMPVNSSTTTNEVQNELQCQGQSDGRNFDEQNKTTESNKFVNEQEVNDSEMNDVNSSNSSRRTSSSSSNGNDFCYSENDTTDNSDNDTNSDVKGEVMFSDSGLTKEEVLMMVHGLSLRHRLSNEARSDVLKLLKICSNLADDETFSTSNYMMSQMFDPNDKLIRYIWYCQYCKSQLKEPTTKQKFKATTVICPNEECHQRQEISLQNNNFFISVDMISQIASILNNNEIFNALNRPKINNDNDIIKDVWDGSIYQNLLKQKVPFNLTYNFSTDGAPIFSSSKSTMWPIQVIINEIPAKIRFKNLIFAGIWVGRREPDIHLMNTFMQSFVSQAETLFEVGVTITKNDARTTFKLLPLCCPCDSVARPVLQNRIQFNGYYGCSWCYQTGEAINRTVKYPFNTIKSALRTNNSHMHDLNSVVSTHFTESIRGVKGPLTLISNLPFFDAVWSFPPDYMHGVALGVIRQLWELWTTYSLENKHTYYIGKPVSLKKINDRILKITPPHEIHRLPRSINEKAKWKASEWRNWLLFYAIPCLNGILKETYINHLALLVKAIFNLLQKNIPISDLDEAEKYLILFVQQFEIHYSKTAMTFNVHSLLHLTESVRRTGPLWSTSTFPFESGIFTIKQQIKGPVGVAKQVAKKMLNINTFLNNLNSNTNMNDHCKMFCNNLWFPDKLHYVRQFKEVTYLGAGNLVSDQNMAFYLSFSNISKLQSSQMYTYKKCIYKNILIHSCDYLKPIKTNDTIIETVNANFIQILKLIVFNNNNYIFGKRLKTKNLIFENVIFTHIVEVISSDVIDYVFLPFNEINEKCIFLTMKENYIAKFPNCFEVQ